MFNKSFFLIVFLIFKCLFLFGQDESLRRNHLSIMTGYSLVPYGEEGSSIGNLIIPALGIDYNYSLSPRFSAGVVSDIELANYGVEKDSVVFLQRNNALLFGISADVKVYKNFKLGTALAREFEVHKNLWVLRFQAEYEIEASETWYITPVLMYNYKIEFDTWGLGINIGRNF